MREYNIFHANTLEGKVITLCQIDCLRYLFVSGAEHITHGDIQVTGGGGY